jgi:hypothetical protein
MDMMSPWSAAIGGALISGVVMYTVGERSERVDAFTQPAPVEYVQTVDGRYIAVTPAPQAVQPLGVTNGLRPVGVVPVAESPVVVERVAAPRQTVYRTQPVQERVVVERAPVQKKRSWQKSALIIGGSAASGAAVGGMVDGKKGALIGAALGGGAASIFEAVKR